MSIRSRYLLPIFLLIAGCGGGHAPSGRLFLATPNGATGPKWVYTLTGSATLPASLGGGTQNLQAGSTLTMQVVSTTATDAANGNNLFALDRIFDLRLVDGRQLPGNLRLYLSQSEKGIFIHGLNYADSATVDPNQDAFFGATFVPPFKWLYLPDVLADGTTLSYGAAGVPSYSLVVGTGLQAAHVPAGDFLGKPVTITEKLINVTNGDFVVTNGIFAPGQGLISGTLDAIFPSGVLFHGTIKLIQIQGVGGSFPIVGAGTTQNFAKSEGNAHVPDGTSMLYEEDPPVSGPHYPVPSLGGFFNTPVPLGNLVHSMEHGGVIIWYDPNRLSTGNINAIKALVTANPGHDGGFFGMVIAVPRTDARYPVILTAWQHRLRLGGYDQNRVQGFITSFLDHGPEGGAHGE